MTKHREHHTYTSDVLSSARALMYSSIVLAVLLTALVAVFYGTGAGLLAVLGVILGGLAVFGWYCTEVLKEAMDRRAQVDHDRVEYVHVCCKDDIL